MKKVLLTALLCAASLTAQTSQAAAQSARAASNTRKTSASATREECIARVGLCVAVPSAWQRLGDAYGELGLVVAEPHEGLDQSLWPDLNVVVLDPPDQPDGTPVTLDAMVEAITRTPSAEVETLQRTRLLLNGNDTQIVRVRLRDPETQAESIEEVALIADEGLVYSFALRCAPQDFDRLDPVFQKAIRNWTITPPPAAQEPEKTPAPANPEAQPGDPAQQNLPNAPSAAKPEDTNKQ
ncbi:MAG: hypothetical protein P4M01_04885 [Acidobacteriota bacterium]|nr:hypothetical protein [Acidobacteriota bacterium]